MLPALTDDRAITARLDEVTRLLDEATDAWQIREAHNRARLLEEAAAIIKNRRIQASAAALVMDAERAMTILLPPTPPAERNPNGAHGSPAPMMTLPPDISPRTISHYRSAHTGLSDERYQELRQLSIEREEPLTRKALTTEATAARLAANVPDSTRLSALNWIGGKSPNSAQGTGRWITSLLPYDEKGIYAEPFGGMAGVLLNRPRSQTEILNDINDRIINWWLVVRRWPDDLQRELERTPYAESEYLLCQQSLDAGPPLERARALTVVICQSNQQSDSDKNSWAPDFSNRLRWPLPKRIQDLAERMQGVQITCRPADALLDRLAPFPHAVIYCDPPYPDVSEAGSLYRHNPLDSSALCAAARRQQGRVCISGNAGDFDEYLPGWATLTRETFRTTLVKGSQQTKPRTECIWLNYDPENGRRLDLPPEC